MFIKRYDRLSIVTDLRYYNAKQNAFHNRILQRLTAYARQHKDSKIYDAMKCDASTTPAAMLFQQNSIAMQ